jgi:hypothetical protein
MCLCTSLQVSVYLLSADFNCTGSFFYLCLYVSAYQENKEIINSNTEIFSEL